MQRIFVVLLAFVTLCLIDINAQRGKVLIKNLHDKIDHLTDLVGMYVHKDKSRCLIICILE